MTSPLCRRDEKSRKLVSKTDDGFGIRATIVSFSPEPAPLKIIRSHPARWSSGYGNDQRAGVYGGSVFDPERTQ
jgi:hypothetical protein